MRIAIVGGSGQSGAPLARLLHRQGHEVWSIGRVERSAGAGTIPQRGADLDDAASLAAAMAGADAVYHIPPPLSTAEQRWAATSLAAAAAADVDTFVYHSVLHAYTPEMPHHHRKAQVEDMVRAGPLRWAIVQPAMYMQTPLRMYDPATHALLCPFSDTARFNPVDVEDVAAAAAAVITDDRYRFGTFELAGDATLNMREMAGILATITGTQVVARPVDATWFMERWFDGEPLAEAVAMCRHYDDHGLRGSGAVLAMLLGRPGTGFIDAARRMLGDMPRP